MWANRLVKARFAELPLNGSGAKATVAAWNSMGVTVLYTPDSVALAALDLLVHLHRSETLNRHLPFAEPLPANSLRWRRRKGGFVRVVQARTLIGQQPRFSKIEQRKHTGESDAGLGVMWIGRPTGSGIPAMMLISRLRTGRPS
jgi:hypothetical protein